MVKGLEPCVPLINDQKSVAAETPWKYEYLTHAHCEKMAFARFLAFSLRLQFSVLLMKQLRIALGLGYEC